MFVTWLSDTVGILCFINQSNLGLLPTTKIPFFHLGLHLVPASTHDLLISTIKIPILIVNFISCPVSTHDLLLSYTKITILVLAYISMASASSCAPTVKSNTICYLNSKMLVSQNLLHSRVFQAFNVSHCYHVFSKLGIGGQLLQGSNYLLTCFKQNAIYQLFDIPII